MNIHFPTYTNWHKKVIMFVTQAWYPAGTSVTVTLYDGGLVI